MTKEEAPPPPPAPSPYDIPCHELREEYDDTLTSVGFWLEGVAICVVGAFGLAGNALAVVVLGRTPTNRNFNKLLIALSVVDSLLILQTVLEVSVLRRFLRYDPGWWALAYPYVIHPLKGFVQTATIYSE